MIVQEEALKQAKARIAELESKASETSFLGSAPKIGPWGAAPRAPAGPCAPSLGSRASRPQPRRRRSRCRWAAGGGGGSFLRTALTTAAGVAGGALLFQGISSMFGHSTSQALANPAINPSSLLPPDQFSQPMSDRTWRPPTTTIPVRDSDDSGFDDFGLRQLERRRHLARTTRGRNIGDYRSLYLDDAERAQSLRHAGGVGLPYKEHAVNISKGEQFQPDFLKISPNNRIPAIVDPDGPGGKPISVFESGAILIYLAEKTGKLIPKDPRKRVATFEWLMWQMGGFGPMLGQAHHFLGMKEPDSTASSATSRKRSGSMACSTSSFAQECVSRATVHHRRHRDPWAGPPRAPQGRSQGLPERQALVRHRQCASGGGQRHGRSVPELTA